MSWKSDQTCVETEAECALIKSLNPSVYFEELAYLKIKFLCQKFERLEWMAGLIGQEVSPRNYKVADIRVIEQEVTGSHVEATSKGRRQLAAIKGCVGWVHSHNTMGSFQSGTDVDTAGNFPVTVTVNNDMDFSGMVRMELKCPHTTDMKIMKKADILVEDGSRNFPELGKQADEFVKEKVYGTQTEENMGTTAWEREQMQKRLGDYGNFKGTYCASCAQKVSRKKRAICKVCGGIAHIGCLSKQGLCKDCKDEIVQWSEAEQFKGCR